MSNNENILLCDMGGTHARFARLIQNGEYADFQKYKLTEFESFESIIQRYMDDTGLTFTQARFALARTPINGVINIKRFAGDPDFDIDFNRLQSTFQWQDVQFLNDLAAGAHGCTALNDSQVQKVVSDHGDKWNDNAIVISVGTGVGHAGIYGHHILETCGGHYLPVTVTDEHRAVEAYIRQHKDAELSLIMEDFVSARGLRMITEYIVQDETITVTDENLHDILKTHPDAIRLFFEFLGLHAHNLAIAFGFFGGICLAGGVIDHLVKHDLADWDAFESMLRPHMLETVNLRLRSIPVYYVLHDELPLLGLTVIE